jgi:hypothetical protein
MIEIKNKAIKKGGRIRPAVWPNIMCTIGLVAIGCTPYLSKNASNELKLMLFVLWVGSTLLLHPFKGTEKGFRIAKWISLLVGLKLIYCLVGLSANILAPIAGLYIWVVPIAMVYICNYYNTNEIKLLWLSFLAIFAINLINNIQIGIIGGESAFRKTEENLTTNAGSTPFVVGCMLLIPTMWIVFRYGNVKWIKYLAIIFIAGAGYYIVFLNTRATAILILIFILIGFVMQVYGREKKLDLKLFFIRMLLLGIIIFCIMAPLINLLSEFFSQSHRMLTRLNDISYVLEGGNTNELGEGSLYARSMLWMTSINTFLGSLPNFLWGIGENLVESDFYSLLRQGVGGHSEFFDLAARYGVIGIFIYYHILKYSYIFIISLIGDSIIKNLFSFILVGILFMGFVNNISNNLTTILFVYLLVPLSGVLLNYKKI